MVDSETLGTTSCDSCHSSVSWTNTAFDHDETAFPLEGIHAEAQCASCHQPDPARPDVVTYKGLPTLCADCHTDTHLGQFELPPDVKTCSDCHAPTGWPTPDFDHGRLADWPLDGRHADTACASCHATIRLEEEDADVTIWRLGPQTCADCHASPHQRTEAP